MCDKIEIKNNGFLATFFVFYMGICVCDAKKVFKKQKVRLIIWIYEKHHSFLQLENELLTKQRL